MSGPTILVADDDASVRLVISQTLAQEGYHVRSTNTMSALWRWIQAGEGDLLITDVYMPDESIFDLLPQIRRDATGSAGDRDLGAVDRADGRDGLGPRRL